MGNLPRVLRAEMSESFETAPTFGNEASKSLYSPEFSILYAKIR